MRKKRRKKKIETSKVLLIVSDMMAAMVLICTIVAIFVIRSTDALTYLIPAVFGLSATSHGFYYWKAKAENMKKIGQEQNVKMNESEEY